MVKVQLTPDQYAAKQTQLAAEGVILSGNAGVASKEGVVIAYSYLDEELTATVLHHPFMVPDGVIESRLTQWLTA